ncbi:MAG: hypothetical protein D3926_15985 [Desulfobacteraceae bacterium]|nr:MAG: hypothetical protein D3926_15985 [Desulfobacteraceae bacterium]
MKNRMLRDVKYIALMMLAASFGHGLPAMGQQAVESGNTDIPLLDQNLPRVFETASFGLG